MQSIAILAESAYGSILSLEIGAKMFADDLLKELLAICLLCLPEIL